MARFMKNNLNPKKVTYGGMVEKKEAYVHHLLSLFSFQSSIVMDLTF